MECIFFFYPLLYFLQRTLILKDFKGYFKKRLRSDPRVCLLPCGSFKASQDTEEAGVPDTADVTGSPK